MIDISLLDAASTRAFEHLFYAENHYILAVETE
jgi:hypothetical protein